jgi:hypothetical protein
MRDEDRLIERHILIRAVHKDQRRINILLAKKLEVDESVRVIKKQLALCGVNMNDHGGLTYDPQWSEEQIKNACIRIPKKTGELCFQFDDDDPVSAMNIFDNGSVTIQAGSPDIVFSDGNSKRMRIFIREAKHEH